MSRYWNPIVKTLTPYVPGEQPKGANNSIKAKLNTNENPYPPSPEALMAMQQALKADLQLYPDSESHTIKKSVADYYSISTKEVFVGNGSDEVLAHIFHGLFNPETAILFPDISYSFYPVYAKLYQLDTKKIPLSESFNIQINDYSIENGGIIFPNPNAPTGKYLSLSEIKKLLQSNKDSVVVIDEAYIDFGGESAISLIRKYDQLLVTQTLSKSRSLAGLRVGFAVGHPDLIEGLNRVKDSFNSYPIDSIAQAGASAAIADKPYFTKTCEKIIASRTYLTEKLTGLGFSVIPSSANFVMAKPPCIKAKKLYSLLKEGGIFVRHFDSPRIEDFLRITVGTQKECELLIKEITLLHRSR